MTQSIREYISMWSILFVCGVLIATGILISLGLDARYIFVGLLLCLIPILRQLRTFSFSGLFLKNKIRYHCLKPQRKFRNSTICEFTGFKPHAEALLKHLNPGGAYFYCVASKSEITSKILNFLEDEMKCRIGQVEHVTRREVRVVAISTSQSAYYHISLSESKVKPGAFQLFCWTDLRPLGSVT